MASAFKPWLREAWRLARRGEWRQAARALLQALARRPWPVEPTPPEVPAPTPAARTAMPDTLAAMASPAAAEPAPDLQPPPALPPETAPVARPRADGQILSAVFAHKHGEIDYHLFVPGGWQDRPSPLVLMLHGCTQDPEDFARGTRMNALAQEQGVLVLYPAQAGSANPARCWNWFSRMHQRRDMGEPALLAALTQSVLQSHGADPQRVYVAGLSAGGAMAVVLGQTWPDLFAAIGVHSGLAFGAASDVIGAMAVMRHGPRQASPLPEALPLPVIVFHGDADSTVHPGNGEQVVAAALGQAEPSEVVVGASDLGQGYTRRIYADPATGRAAEHWLLHGAGHAWAGGDADGSFTDPAGPDASREMLRFFLDHPQPARH